LRLRRCRLAREHRQTPRNKRTNHRTTARALRPARGRQADEIVRAAPPTTQSFGPLPAGANVTFTDEMLAGADSDAKN
jgi:hypothetical protein